MPGIIILLILFIFCLSLLISIIYLAQGAPFVRSDPETIQAIIHAAHIKKGVKTADLGSGDGLIVIALARAGAEAHGFEINPLLVWKSKEAIKKAGLERSAFVHWKSFWKADLSEYDVITLYGIQHIMDKLQVKLQRELKPKARVVSNYFVFKKWHSSHEHGRVHVYTQKI
jgi:cyclopropane fatty-acyl-phospholipid synthase-like methyltransferase